MPDKPLLILPRSNPLPRATQQRSIKSYLKLPDRRDQAKRIGPQLTKMRDAFITDSPIGTSSENILVLETVGRLENFLMAVNAIPGLRWLAEIDTEDIEADDWFFERPKIGSRFFKDRGIALNLKDSSNIVSAFTKAGIIDSEHILQEHIDQDKIVSAIPKEYIEYSKEIIKTINEAKSKPLQGRIYLSLSNREALGKIKTLFDDWDQRGRLPYGAGAWSDIFHHLRSIRFWDVEDRVRDTGILAYWQKEVELKRGTASTISFEIEFSYDDDQNRRLQRQQDVQDLVLSEGGTITATCHIPEIHFHAIKVELPVSNIERFLGNDYSALFKYGSIFVFRPSPQCITAPFPDGSIDDIPSIPAPEAQPVVAVLDGLPFSQHNLLDGFIIIDDPDDFAAGYQPRELNHGSAMLSLICHGELDANERPITRKVYVRPILKPDEESPLPKRPERIPKNVFFEDLIERAVHRMFSGEANEPASAPTIKIINLSVADPDRMFHRFPGPTARLLDWLSFRYKVLFCVSAGNITDPIFLGIDETEFSNLSDEEKYFTVLSAIYNERRNRRILSPSDSINALTIGALHDDKSTPVFIDGYIDILPSKNFPSPISPFGHGFRSSIKPEILIPGGRQYFKHIGGGKYDLPQQIQSGQKVASVPVMPGERNRTIYTCGTSNATALAVRNASFIHDTILEVFKDHKVTNADDSLATLIKTLLVHGASWGKMAEIIEGNLLSGRHGTEVKKELSRFLGYGHPDFRKSIECTNNRATAIGYGVILKDERHEYRIPLPPSLSGLDCWRRLTITLGWFSPISLGNRKYRKAALTFEPKNIDKVIGGRRAEAQWQQVKNGTLQHEIFEGEEVCTFSEGDYLVIPVQCREDAGPLDVGIPYGIAVSLEVKEEVEIPIYEEIKNLIEISIRELILVA